MLLCGPHKIAAHIDILQKSFLTAEDDKQRLITNQFGVVLGAELLDVETVFGGGLAHYRLSNRDDAEKLVLDPSLCRTCWCGYKFLTLTPACDIEAGPLFMAPARWSIFEDMLLALLLETTLYT